MIRILLVSFVLLFFGALSIPFDAAHANKMNGRASQDPTGPMPLYMPSPFNSPKVFDTPPQKE